MRTNALGLMNRSALLVALLLGGGALVPGFAGAQAADTIPAEREITAEPVEAVAPEEEAATTAEAAEEPAAATDPQNVRVIGGNRTIAEGEVVRDVTVIGGNLRVHGEVTGDATVVGGNLTLYETGRIRGDVTVAGGRFRNQGGQVAGEMRTVDRVPGVTGTAPAAQREVRTERRRGTALGRIGRGFAGIVSTVALGLVLAGVGAALIFYGRRYLDTVNDTIRTSTLRSGAVGLAALFLAFPFYIVLIVALAVTVIGIPVLLVVIPLYPLAVIAAMTFGLLATAHALGERTSEQKAPYDLRYRNAYTYLFTGLVLLLAPVMAGHLVGMTPFLGWVGTLIRFLAYVAIWAATVVGLGAVILSRGGTRRSFAGPVEPPLEDPLLEEDPFVGEPRG